MPVVVAAAQADMAAELQSMQQTWQQSMQQRWIFPGETCNLAVQYCTSKIRIVYTHVICTEIYSTAVHVGTYCSTYYT